ncbi:MAG: nucleoside phosphorylase [Chloroflexi bacterium]|nr:nucleoside phosphorylase [Chloroflexota bacterium]
MNFQSAAAPFTESGLNYHLRISARDVASTVLLPGDPGRVALISSGWDSFEAVGENREFVTHTGIVQGMRITAISTGIGNPAMATVVESLARMGAKTLLRIGTTGAIQPGIELGDLIIARAAVRLDGASKAYVRPEYPAAAHQEAVMALIQACEELGYRYHVGVTASTDSWYLGQGRPGWQGYAPSFSSDLLPDLQAAGVLNFEMESSALLTIAGLYQLRAGAIFAVVANRTNDTFQVIGVDKAVAAANRAALILRQMDEEKQAAGAAFWHPGLRRQEGNSAQSG